MTRTLLIQLSGPASSGKTTLALALAEHLGGYFVGEPIESSVEEKLRDDAEAFQNDVLKKHYMALKWAVSQNKIVITDRALWDLAIYGDLNIEEAESAAEYKLSVTQACRDLERNIDHITYGLRSVGFEENGVRYSPDYQKEVDMFSNAKYVTRFIDSEDFTEKLSEILGDLK